MTMVMHEKMLEKSVLYNRCILNDTLISVATDLSCLCLN